MAFWVYMLKCADDSYYIGHTEDLERRIAQHQGGEIAGYTHSRRPITLIYAESFPTRLEALAMERRIKGWTRAKKDALARGDWQRVSALARKRRR
jgi:predicted GIY-YIG superfamily endonuclease